MLWLLGKLFRLIMLLLIAGALIAVVALVFVDANTFKDKITQSIMDHTGRTVTINGDIQWTLHPEFAIFINDMSVDNMSTIKTLSLYIDPYSLFSERLVVESLQAQGAKITIDTLQVTQIAAQALPLKKLFIQKAEITEATFTLLNADNLGLFELREASITTGDLMINGTLNVAPIEIKGKLVDLSNNFTLNITTTFNAELDKQIINLDPLAITWQDTTIQGSGTVSQYNTEPIFTAKMSVNNSEITELLQKLDPYFDTSKQDQQSINLGVEFSYYTEGKILDITNINLILNNGSLNGSLKVGFTSPYQANFELAANDLNFNPLITVVHAMLPKMPTEGTLFSSEFINNLIMSGKLTGTNIILPQNFAVNQISLSAIAKDGLLQISPIIMNAYDSTHNMSLYLDGSKDLPFIQFSDQADNVDLTAWLKLFNIQNVISGNAKLSLQLEAIGNDIAALKQSLTGGINIFVENGTYFGLDLDKLMAFEISLIDDTFNQLASGQVIQFQDNLNTLSSGWIDTQTDSPLTAFKTADLKAIFKTGVTETASIAMTTENYSLKGNGVINFIDNTINFNALITSIKKQDLATPALTTYVQQNPFPLHITGTTAKPIYGPDIKKYATTALEGVIKTSTATALNKMISATPPNQATDKTATELFIDSLQGLAR